MSEGEHDAESERFLQLFAQYQRRIHAFVSGMVPCQSDADDIMQETCLVLWRKRAEFDMSRDFTRWACGFAFREVLKFRRNLSTRKCVFSEELLEQLASESINTLDEVETRYQALTECLRKLRPRDLELIQKRYESAKTTRQLAEQTGRSESTVYKALTRIRELLYDCIQRSLVQEYRT